MKHRSLVIVGVAVVMLVLAAAAGSCQPGVPGQGMGGQQGQGMGQLGVGGPGFGMPAMAPTVQMVVADGVLYVACEGQVMAFDAKTLEKLAEATYWHPPARPARNEG